MYSLKCYVNLGQISDIIGEEEWMTGEVTCLSDITSNRITSYSWGAKKMVSNSSEMLLAKECLSVGDYETVSNNEKNGCIVPK